MTDFESMQLNSIYIYFCPPDICTHIIYIFHAFRLQSSNQFWSSRMSSCTVSVVLSNSQCEWQIVGTSCQATWSWDQLKSILNMYIVHISSDGWSEGDVTLKHLVMPVSSYIDRTDTSSCTFHRRTNTFALTI